MLKRIVTIQDVSCFGKCSSTVALPLISAMGVETAVIPTAVLSTHTGGFTGYTFRDLTADIPQIAAHWKTLQLHFDGIYTGYLGSREQVQIMADFFDAFRSEDTVIVVDPVMGDAGSYYAAYREHVPEPMHGTGDIFASVLSGALVRGASIEQALSIAVNFTADTIQATLPDLRTLPREEAPWYGVEFEACIGNLVDYVKEIHS